MRSKTSILTVGVLAGLLATLAPPREASAQVIPPNAERDENWGAVSTVSMLIGVGTVTLMPRVYYNDPEATVGWKARWHVSQLAPALTLTAATLLVDGPLKDSFDKPRPGCTVEETEVGFAGSNCESYGMPSAHNFAAWSAAGAGTGIWLMDTFIHSDGEFHAGSFIGNVAVPITAGIFTSVGRSVEPGTSEAYVDGGQMAAGLISGVVTGFLTGIAYSLLQEPNCGYGNYVICW